MDTSKIIPSHAIADWLLGLIEKFLAAFGLERFKSVEEWIYAAVVIAVSFAVGWIVKTLLLWGLRKAVALRHNSFGEELLQLRTMAHCSHIVPPLVFLAFIPFAFTSGSKILIVLERVAWIYVLVALGIGLSAVISFAYYHYNVHRNTKNLPLQGVRNLAVGIVWIIITIVAVSVAFDKSPATLLAGLGAFAAALMLVFRDSILGFVAGIQMSQNDMLHVGDWIVVPSTIANGTVIDVSLTAVKVQNWDNTIVTVPPYTLVSTCLQNYRGMKDSGARRIVKDFVIDVTTIKPLDGAAVDALVAKYPMIKTFVDNLRAAGKTECNNGGTVAVNGTLQTNLGLYRAYISQYIYDSPDFSKEQQLLVRLMDSVESGIPLEIYCFTSTTDWEKYEAIQSALMEHVATSLADFGLSIYALGEETIDINTPTAKSAAKIAPQAQA